MRFRWQFIGATTLAIMVISGVAAGASGSDGAAENQTAAEDHTHHHMAAISATTRSTVSYAIPDVKLIRQDGTVVNLNAELNDGRPVVLSFIYTSCTSVCPLVSHTLSQLQNKLGEHAGRVHLMSITIDPEQDDPARLREYAKTFHAGPEWQHYTGTLAASQTVQRAFDVYRGNKMDHVPATLIRPAQNGPWIRIEGFATADQMLAELSDLSQLHAAR
ncbi:MAG TPA: SCO family protein [Steroidobacteraceae bacterium]|jgi:protein SCO1/2|nr:SCO family protein [Steroidobacteraceae bacterium]